MPVPRTLRAVIVSLTPAIPAAAEIGPGDVVTGPVAEALFDCLLAGTKDSQLSCFEAPGVPQGARDLARGLVAAQGAAGVLSAFHEVGRIDLAEVIFPTFANTNDQFVLVNGPDGLLMATDLNFTREPPATRGTGAILARFPQAFETGRVFVPAVRALPGGGQRFVLTDIAADGCRACQPVAVSQRYPDFTEGRLLGIRDLGWQPWTDEPVEVAINRMRTGEIAAFQGALNVQGYDAGPVDGVAGPQTRAALAAFKADHCLPANAQMTPRLVDALGLVGPGYPRPPCESGPATGVTLPFADGVYATDPRLCPPVDPAVAMAFGDRAYTRVAETRAGNWVWGESACMIRAAVPLAGDLRLEFDCLSEGIEERRAVILQAVDAAGFSYLGERFAACPARVD
ncbi:peptidoglycan-binding domain-containing protein [Thetidibacter halocola]|uniref:Peptidoglycan-binding protein n=1 Tax=Thetidibacter halocola TaxID=2827239 RepID=A0A8J7WJC6_9RHOB|nr:peptidoglycan-binding domain-containing protein [Thetidibacter halocola]MBS0126296.1 peptidoglycan-binding protein [Thetidibacter halocola]